MTVGEVISAIALYSSSVFENNRDALVMAKGLDSIEVYSGFIRLYFTDGNTPNVKIDRNGERLP